MLDQLATMTTKMNLPSKRHEMAMFKAIKSEVIFLATMIQQREPTGFNATSPKNLKGKKIDVNVSYTNKAYIIIV